MKFEAIEESGKPAVRFTFSVSVEEAKLLAALLRKAKIYMPGTFDGEIIRNRMEQMTRNLEYGLRKWKQ